MPLNIQDFVAQASGNISVDDIPPEVQERVNGALKDLTGGGGSPSGPAGDLYDAIVKPGGGDSENTFSEIQSAVDNVESGAAISVEAGTYSEMVSIDTRNITIFGAGQGETIIDASGKKRGIEIEADGVQVQSLTVDNAGKNVVSGEVEGVFINGGFSNTSSDILIESVEITNVNGGDKTAEGIHVKSYGENKIDGIKIDNVTIDDITETNAGANGIKLQADIKNITISDSVIRNVNGSWTYGVTLTASENEPGTPSNVSLEASTIEDVSATDYDGVGVGIGSSTGEPEPATNNGKVANPQELSFDSSTIIRNADIGILDKNTEEPLTFGTSPSFEDVETETREASVESDSAS